MPYNPFEIPIGKPLDPQSLNSLVTNKVAEGYYVEYKSQFPLNTKIGQSIASFANTYGGWYIVGVETDAHNIASTIPGFSLTKFHDPISKIREIVKSHIDPTPIFFTQVVELSEDLAVLIVYIPGEQETPFVSKDGRIYRRSADSSEPVYEKDRYTIDQLVKMGRKKTEKFKRFCRDERTFSEAELDVPWAKLYFYPYPNNVLEVFTVPNETTLEKLIELSKQELEFRLEEELWAKGNIPFDFGQLTVNSVILRQGIDGQLGFNSLTAELFRNGCAKFFLPIDTWEFTKKGEINKIQSKLARLAALNTWGTGVYSDANLLKFTNIGNFFLNIICITNYYMEWVKEQDLLTDLKVGIELDGVWRLVPFDDSDEWGEYVLKYGLPTMSLDHIQLPRDLEYTTPLNLNDINNLKHGLWIALSSSIGQALGLPLDLSLSILHQEALSVSKKRVSVMPDNTST